MEYEPTAGEVTELVVTPDFWDTVDRCTWEVGMAQSPAETDAIREEVTVRLTTALGELLEGTSWFGVAGDVYCIDQTSRQPQEPTFAVLWGLCQGVCFEDLPSRADNHSSEAIPIISIFGADGSEYFVPLTQDTIMMTNEDDGKPQVTPEEDSYVHHLIDWGDTFHTILTSPGFLNANEEDQRAQVATMQKTLTDEISERVGKDQALFVRVRQNPAPNNVTPPPGETVCFLSTQWRCIVPEYEAHGFMATRVDDYSISGGMPCIELTDPEDETKHIIPIDQIVTYNDFFNGLPEDVSDIEDDTTDQCVYMDITAFTQDEAIVEAIDDVEDEIRFLDASQTERITAEVKSLNDLLDDTDNRLDELPTFFDGTVYREDITNGIFFEAPLFYRDCAFCGFDIIEIEGTMRVVYVLEIPEACFTHQDDQSSAVKTEIVYVLAHDAAWRTFTVYEDTDDFIVECFDVEAVVEADKKAQSIIGTKDYRDAPLELQVETLDDLCHALDDVVSPFRTAADPDEEITVEIVAGEVWSIPVALYNSAALNSLKTVTRTSSKQTALTVRGDKLDAVIPELETSDYPIHGKMTALNLSISGGIPMLRLEDTERQMVHLIVTKSIQSIVRTDEP